VPETVAKKRQVTTLREHSRAAEETYIAQRKLLIKQAKAGLGSFRAKMITDQKYLRVSLAIQNRFKTLQGGSACRGKPVLSQAAAWAWLEALHVRHEARLHRSLRMGLVRLERSTQLPSEMITECIATRNWDPDVCW